MSLLILSGCKSLACSCNVSWLATLGNVFALAFVVWRRWWCLAISFITLRVTLSTFESVSLSNCSFAAFAVAFVVVAAAVATVALAAF